MKTIKITTVGSAATGKGNLLMAFERPDFQYVYQLYVSCTFAMFKRELLIDGEKIDVVMQHIPGQEDYARVRPFYYPVTDVCLIIFSVIRPSTFEEVADYWLPEVHQYLPTTPCLFVGTKSDLRNCQTTLDELAMRKQKLVTLEEIYTLCKTYQVPYFETSAHTGFGVEECFYEAVRTALKFKYDMNIPYSTKIFNILGPNDTLRRFIVDKLIPAPIQDNMAFGVSLGFDSKTIKLYNKEFSIEDLRWQLLKFFIETVDEMGTLPYRFIYKALRKCKQISLAEELVECLNQDQDLMSVGLGGKIVHEKVNKKVKVVLRKRLASFSFCVEDQTPQSIWKMGSQAHSLYMEILKSGTERRYIIRIMIVGPFGVGKTCLLRRLLKKDIHDDIFRCRVQLNNGLWIFDDDFDEGKERKSRLLRKVVTSQEYNKTAVDTAKESSKPNINKSSVDFFSKLFSDSDEVKKSSQDTISPRIGSNQDQPVVQKTKSKPNTVQSPHKDLLDDFQGIHDSDVSYEDIAEVRILDFAGQYEFYATHQTFLNKNAIYLLALDMSKDLKGILPHDDLDEGFKDITEIPFEDIGEYVNFWLDAIHCYAENAEEEQTNYSLPPIVVVGTCSDKLNDKKKREVEIQDQLEQLLDGHPKGKHIRDFIFLSNTTSTESEYDLLRDKIVELGSQLSTWGQELPVRWIKLGEILHQLKESQTVLISREEVIELGKNMEPGIHNEMEIILFLKYEHETGNVIYFDDISEFVILRPQWLIDVLKCLISPRKFKKKRNIFVSNDWKDLEQTGRLTEHLFTEVFNSIIVGEKSVLYKEHVLKVLEKFDIIVKPCCIENNSAQQTLYTEANATHINISLENKSPITGSPFILQNTTSPVHEDQARTNRVLSSDVIVGNIQDSISTPHISSEYTYPKQIPELRKDGYEVQDDVYPFTREVDDGGIEVQDEIGQLSRDTSSLQDITSPEITEVHEGGIEVQDEIGQVSRDTSSLQDITSPEITEVHEGGIEVQADVYPFTREVDDGGIEIQDEIGQVSSDTSSLQDITSPEITEVHEGGIEVQDDVYPFTREVHDGGIDVQDEIGQVSSDTSSLQVITTAEITEVHGDVIETQDDVYPFTHEVHDGGIEVQNEIGQVSRDTLSLQDITSPEITEVHEGGIEVQDDVYPFTHEVHDGGIEVQYEIGQVSINTSSLQDITTAEITEVHEGGIEVQDDVYPFTREVHDGGFEVRDEIGQVSRDTLSLQDIISPEITEVHEGGIEVQDEIGQVSRDTSSLQDITRPEITDVHEGGIEVQDDVYPFTREVHYGGIEVRDEIGQVSSDTSSLQDITSPEITEVHEGGIEVQDEIGQVSRDTSSLQNITSPEITDVHAGGIEVQDETGQLSRDTLSLQDSTSSEITEVHEGEIEVQDVIGQVSPDASSLQGITSPEEQESDIGVYNEICEGTHETCSLHSIRSQDNAEVQDDGSEVQVDINLVTHATLVAQPTNSPIKGVSEQQKQPLQTLEDMNIHNDSTTRRSTNDGIEPGIPYKKTGDNHNKKPRKEHLDFQKQTTEFLDYYVPCLIKAKPIKNVQEHFKIEGINCQRTSWVCMDFDFLPPAFFNHVLVGYIRRYQISREPSKRGNRLALYRGMCVFNLDTSGCTKLAVCVYGKVIQFQIWDWCENFVKSYKKVWENAVDCIAEIKRRYNIHVSYTINMKCCDGSYDNPDGMVEISKLQKDEQYFCDEHAITHNSKDLLDDWFKDGLSMEMLNYVRIATTITSLVRDSTCSMLERHTETLNLKCDPSFADVYSTFRQKTRIKSTCVDQEHSSWQDDVEKYCLIVKELRQLSQPVLNTDEYKRFSHELHCVLSRFDKSLPQKHYLEKFLKISTECFGQEQYDSSVQAIFKDKIIDDVEVCITRHSERLIHEVQICGILDYMMSQCTISTEDRKDIEHHPRPSEQNKALLALIQKRGQVVYDVFIEALSHGQYRNLAELLVLDKEPDTTTTQTGESKETTELKSWTNVWPSKVRLQKNYIDIITTIKHDMITDHLISKGILTLDDMQVIEASPAQSDKNRKLLEILLQSAKNGLDEFLIALRLDDVYTDLAEQIEKTTVGPAEIRRLQNCFQDKHL